MHVVSLPLRDHARVDRRQSVSPFTGVAARSCRTCRDSIGTSDGWHLWCERHRIVVVFPCALWEREAGADERETGIRRIAARNAF